MRDPGTIPSARDELQTRPVGAVSLTRERVFSPFNLLALLLTAIALLLIVWPLANAFVGAFVIDGQLNLDAFVRVFTDDQFHLALLNTGIIMITAGPLALIIGSVLAWLNERTNAGFGWLSTIMPIVPLLVPSIAMAVGWVFLGNERAGYLNMIPRAVMSWFGPVDPAMTGPIHIASWGGMIFVYTIVLVPYVYLVVAAALRNTDSALEEASRMSGAGVVTTLMRVSLPAVLPAIASSALLVLIVGSSLFSIPRTIGTAARIDVLSTYIVRLTRVYPAKLDEAMAVSVLLLVILGGAWWAQQRVAERGRHSTVSGKSGSTAIIELGAWRAVFRTIMIVYILLVSLLPFLALLFVGLQPFWTASIDPSILTTKNFVSFFGAAGELPRRSLVTSILLGAVGATISMAAVAVMVHWSKERRGMVSQVVGGVTKAPGAISHIVFGVAILVTFAGPPLQLSGTLAILLIAYFVIYLPQASTSAEVARGQVSTELIEASAMSGASRFQTFRKVLIPLMLPGLAAGWALMFVVIVGDLTASAILSGHTNPVVSFVFLDIWDNGTLSMLATLGVIVSATTSIVVVAALLLGRGSTVIARMGRTAQRKA